MADEIKKCTIVSGAPNDNIEFLKSHIDRASFIIAADSGYKKLLSAEIIPDAIVADFDFTEINQENADSLLEKLSISLVSIDHSIVLTFENIIYANENGMLYWFDDGTDTDSPYLCLHPYYQEDGNLFIDENVQGLFYTSETGEKRIGGSTITTKDSSEFESASKLYNISDIGVSKDSKYFQIIDDKLYYHNNDEDNYYFIVDLNDIK